MQLEKLNEENTALRNRLRDVAYSPLSDNEKQELLQRHHNSAPASIATNVSHRSLRFEALFSLFFVQLLEDGTGGDITACPTPDWDKQSSGNVSEVSVACLQDKINQMQETHYRYCKTKRQFNRRLMFFLLPVRTKNFKQRYKN